MIKQLIYTFAEEDSNGDPLEDGDSLDCWDDEEEIPDYEDMNEKYEE